ncbi:hypothetical protein FH972_016278 [Carpinus fangiana]|uniref:Uncharacterized protein n=1 Tax=Carpinus fangiana TaxID=176857 RepID=A0A5N6RIS6_9ROSI|nr:hypothetical protein FH972_016278 [Carpinus fangiana]
MAMQAGRLIQDQNFNVHCNGASVGGKTNVPKAERKGGIGARKPLSDLSNSEKPVLNQAPKKQTSKKVTFIDEHSGASKMRNDTNKRTSISRASAKLQTGSRKALSDISNSGKAHLNGEATNKNLNLKLGVVAEEPLHHVSAIAEERFLHNHQECIKAQTKSMDLDEFLKTVGLDNDLSKYLATPCAPSMSRKLKPENSQKKYHLELEEMAEQLIEDGGFSWKHGLLSSKPAASPLPPCMTPKSPRYSTHWKDYDLINFKLMETPELPRH